MTKRKATAVILPNKNKRMLQWAKRLKAWKLCRGVFEVVVEKSI